MKKQPNVLIFYTDQLRHDCLGCHGHEVVKTPNIDSLASTGVDFQQTYTQIAECMPSRISLFTGQYPHVHGVQSNSSAVDTSHLTTLPAFLREKGYQTALIGKSHVGPSKIMGFDYTKLISGVHPGEKSDYNEYLKAKGLYDKYVRNECFKEYDSYVSEIPYKHSRDRWTGDRSIQFLQKRKKDKPFFLWTSFQRPHAPTCVPFDNPFPYDTKSIKLPEYDLSFYTKPDTRRVGCENAWNVFTTGEEPLKQAIANYLSLVSMIDAEVGRIVKFLDEEDELENTIILFTSDHGDFCGEFGQFGKQLSTFDVLYKVPLIFNWKGVTGREQFHELVEVIDIMPTILDLIGFECPRTVQGESIAPAVIGSSKREGMTWEGKEAVFFEKTFIKTVRTKTHKLSYCFRGNREWGQLYDLVRDPGEKFNLYGDPNYKWVQDDLMKKILQWLISTEQPQVHSASHIHPPVPWRWFAKSKKDENNQTENHW